MSGKPLATWTLELNVECPNCKEYIDLLEDGDFWEENRVDICEHSTKRSKSVDAYCDECKHDFEVELTY